MKKKGVNFFTDNHYNQQVGFMKHERNKVILPHIHKKVIRDIRTTTEVIYIMKGSLRIDFYDSKKKYLFSNTAKENYIVILIRVDMALK